MSSFSHNVTSRLHRHESAQALTMERAAYWIVVSSIYISFGVLWYFSAKEKLIDDGGTMPAGLAKAYEGSFVASVPGLDAAWVLIGVLEAVAFVAIVASLVRGEFLAGHAKPILFVALGLSLLTFAVLVIGQTMTANYDSVAQLFGYMAATGVALLLVLVMPPSRGLRWPGAQEER